jgi:tetratricopeptide (TPR) repeat protein
MGIFSKLFGKNTSKTKHINSKNRGDKKAFNYSINTNAGNITFTTKMTEEEIVQKYEQQLINESNPISCERKPFENEIKIATKDFFENYKYGIIGYDNEIGSRVNIAYDRATWKGYNYFVIFKVDFDYIVKRHNKWMERERTLSKTVELNFKGKDLEKEGKIDEAIKCYEENVKLCYPAMMSYDRLLVLYRKKKDYENEKRICLLTIDMCKKENERRLQNTLSNKENEGLEEQIIDAHNENRTLFVEGRQFCVYNPYEVSKYKDRLEKINKKIQNV